MAVTQFEIRFELEILLLIFIYLDYTYVIYYCSNFRSHPFYRTDRTSNIELSFRTNNNISRETMADRRNLIIVIVILILTDNKII